jgi:hypothetical protein
MIRALGASVLVCTVIVAVALRAAPQQTQGPQGQGQGQAQQTPPPAAGRGQVPAPSNLQVLPKDWTAQQVVVMMRTFTAGLGVMCDHCHVGSPQDRAKDDKTEKATARKMIQMVATLNDQLKDIGTPAEPGTPPAPKVTCYTCHRGAVKPLTAPPPGGGL